MERIDSLLKFIDFLRDDCNHKKSSENNPPDQLSDLSNFLIEEDLVQTEDFMAFKGNFGDSDKPSILKIRPSKPKPSELKQLMESMELRLTNKYGKGFGFYKAKCLTTKSFNVDVIYPWVEPDDNKQETKDGTQIRLQEQQKLFDKFYKRTLPKQTYIVRETPEMYRDIQVPYIQSIPQRAVQWVYDILDEKREAKGIVVKDDDADCGFIVCPDSKWKSHPNVEKIAKSEWKLNDSISKSFYLLCLVRDKSIKSLRDLKGKHIKMLENILYQSIEAAKAVYGIDKNQLRIFVHYPPQYWHFHIHFTCLAIDYGIYAGKAILLEDIIDNLKMDPAYYQKANLSCVVFEGNPLLQKA